MDDIDRGVVVILRFYNQIKTIEAWIGDDVKPIQADCVVRHELNGWRKLHDAGQVIRGITHDPYLSPPVMPREFPKGRWEVYTPRARTDEYLAPYFIPTNAEQYLEIWDLDENGGYAKASDKKVLDIGYGLHHSTSGTTVGCIKIYREEDVLWLRNVITEQIERGDRVWLEV